MSRTGTARWTPVLLVLLTAVGLLAMHGLGGTLPKPAGHSVAAASEFSVVSGAVHGHPAAPPAVHGDGVTAPDGECADSCGEHLLMLCLTILVTLAAVLLPHLQQRRALLVAPRRGPPPTPPALRHHPQPPDLVADLCTSRR